MKDSSHSLVFDVYLSFSPRDDPMRDSIDRQLSKLELEGLIRVWHTGMISPGTDWRQEAYSHLNKASLVLLLASADYLSSEWCIDEANRALGLSEVRVIPVLIRPCIWASTPFGHLQQLPRNGKPISEWSQPANALLEVEKEVRVVIEELGAQRETKRLLSEQASLTLDDTAKLSPDEKKEKIKQVQEELNTNFENRVAQRIQRIQKESEANSAGRLTQQVQQVKGISSQHSTSFKQKEVLLKVGFTGSLLVNLIGGFELLIYLLPWAWLIRHPNSYGLQISFDCVLILMTIGALFPQAKKWCWGVGAFGILAVILQLLGGPSVGK